MILKNNQVEKNNHPIINQCISIKRNINILLDEIDDVRDTLEGKTRQLEDARDTMDENIGEIETLTETITDELLERDKYKIYSISFSNIKFENDVLQLALKAEIWDYINGKMRTRTEIIILKDKIYDWPEKYIGVKKIHNGEDDEI